MIIERESMYFIFLFCLEICLFRMIQHRLQILLEDNGLAKYIQRF